MPRELKEERLNNFLAVYEKKLRHSVKNHPELYNWPDGLTTEEHCTRMRHAIQRGSYLATGPAFSYTCKELGLAPVRETIEAYLMGY